MPTHHPGTKCPQYLSGSEYEQMQRRGKKITKVLRHTNRRGKLGDGATMDPTKLAVICSQIRRCRLSVRDIWKIVQEGQADSKCRVMVLLATHYDGKIMGWSNKLGPEPAHDECTDFSHRTYYDKNDTCIDMRVVGFKCTQGMSPNGCDLQLWQHFRHWWNWEVKGHPLPQWMFHVTDENADWYIQNDRMI